MCSPGSGTAGRALRGKQLALELARGWAPGGVQDGRKRGGWLFQGSPRPLKGHSGHTMPCGAVRATYGSLTAFYGLLAVPLWSTKCLRTNYLQCHVRTYLRQSYEVRTTRTPYGTYGAPPSAAKPHGYAETARWVSIFGGRPPKDRESDGWTRIKRV